MKKIASLIGAGALLFGFVGTSFAFGGTIVKDNFAKVWTDLYSKANTGFNEIHGKVVKGGSIKTDFAVAETLVSNMVNSAEVDCGCGFTMIKDNTGKIYSDLTAKANTGFNEIGGKYVLGGRIRTGSAGASALVSNVINSVVTPVEPEPAE